MKRLASSFFAVCLSFGMGVPALTSMAEAAPPIAIPLASSGPVENVQYYDYRHRRHWQQYPERNWRHHHPRYRHHHRHYRGPRIRPPRAYRRGNAHVRWCYNRYRSYRAYDNTYQPYNGPRRQCYSPFI
ncbi:BA14K family protein [Falsochrobactrum sp. TDYN1]|uniref:Lectin-like protein BA14k n=1 Tax=Falsochrobactrum tianjinense TaxID=2706015 RepID=A0A949UTG2_9HYPH|nr:BA14K family protein [Falsochrobactrum sp. TDYN1]MBV2142336.1 BA14K family protein [Falsochrobactrum sp. TDYN1]